MAQAISHPPEQRVALVGPDQQENLALRYLAAALVAAGHSPVLVPFNTRADATAAVEEILHAGADIVGLGIAFQYSIDDYLVLVAKLRERGFRGHITCGGHVPTFCYAELLRDAPGIDTVVRHEGEQTIVELAACLSRRQPAQGIAGLVWRTAVGIECGPVREPVPDLDVLSLPTRGPKRYFVGGVPIAFLLTGRGCVGDCAYCCIRAFGRDSRGPALRLRNPEHVVQEIASLYERGVRTFFVQDDLFILPSERRTLARMRELIEALQRRGVGRIAFWIKGRPESITPAVLQTGLELGAIHVFLGVESGSKERLRYLGRSHSPEDNRRAIALCREHRVRTSFNFMLFDPDCTLEQVSSSLDLAAENLDLPWNLCRTEIYSGTELLTRLRAEQRLRGDYRSYGYRMLDERAEVMFRIVRVAFDRRALAFDSLLNRLISLSFARQVHEHFLPGSATRDLVSRVDAVLIESHRDTVETLRRILDWCAGGQYRDAELARAFARDTAFEVNARDAAWSSTIDQLWNRASAGWRKVEMMG